MTAVEAKIQVLHDAGYDYTIARMAYLNMEARKMFSAEFVQTHSASELAACINEPGPPDGEWRFYYNGELSESVKSELLQVLANGRANRR